jgi:aldose sugar dehydrogenase
MRFSRLTRGGVTRVIAVLAFSLALLILNPLQPSAAAFDIESDKGSVVKATEIARFDEPWAMTFLPDGTLLVTTKPGRLFHVRPGGAATEVGGMWAVDYGGQGGLGDVVLHPSFAENNLVYISSVEASKRGSTRGAIVNRARLDRSGGVPKLVDVERIWTQEPKVSGRGHYSHRIAFAPDGMLFITSGERQKLHPAQDFGVALGKIVRLTDDGRVPPDNPWQDRGELAKSFWSMGHRNMLGIAFDATGRLWAHEMGPRHGDELNLIVPGANYGWPVVSNGNHYSGKKIPDHHTRPDFAAPKAFWVPAISPAGFIIYDGALFAEWRGNALIGGLSSRALVRIELEGETATEAERFRWGARVREVDQGPDGALWLLEDGAGGRLLKLVPAN